MKNEEVFIQRFEGLRRFSRAEYPTLDEVLDAANKLRILVTETEGEKGLIDRITEDLQRQVVFRVHPPLDRGAERGVLLDVSFDGSPPPFGGGVELNLREFRKYPLVTMLDETYTVEHVIWLVANSLGGSHMPGPNHRPVVEKLRELDSSTKRGGDGWGGDYNWSIHFIRDIARLVVHACEPVYLLVRARSW